MQDKFTITKEQLDAITSDYATRDVISIVVADVMKHKDAPKAITGIERLKACHAGELTNALRSAKNILDQIDVDRHRSCLLYHLARWPGYCHSPGGCPFGQDGNCGLRATLDTVSDALADYGDDI